LIVLLGVLFFMPGLGQVPLYEADEPRFSTAGREMLESGNFVTPRFNGQLRPDKPPLLYWLMSASYSVFGVNEFAARLPSVICGTLTLIVVYFMVGSRFGRVTGMLASLMLGSCGLFVAVSRLATADSTMIFFTTCALAVLWRAFDAAHKPEGILPQPKFIGDTSLSLAGSLAPAQDRPVTWVMALCFWLALAAGILTKGVPLLLIGVCALTLVVATGPSIKKLQFNWRWLGALKPALGVPLLLVVCGTWAYLAWQQNPELLKKMLGHHVVERATAGVDGHAKLPGFYVLMAFVTLWPWSFLKVPTVYHVLRRLRGKAPIAIDRRPYVFLVAYIVPSWVLFEIFKSKLVHYVLPLYIGIIILMADMIVQSWHRLTEVLAPRWIEHAKWLWLLVWLTLAGLLLWGIKQTGDEELFWRAVPAAGALAGAGVASTIAWLRRGFPYVTVLGFAGVCLMLHVLVLPAVQPLQTSKQLAAAMNDYRREEPDLKFGALGYQESTLVFYAGRQVRFFKDVDEMVREVGFGADVRAESKYLITIDAKVKAELQKRGVPFVQIREIKTVELPAGKPVTATLISNITPKLYSLGPATQPATATAPATGPSTQNRE